MADNIVYNHAAVSGLSGDIGSQAAQLMEIHGDVLHLTQALGDFFQGHGATASRCCTGWRTSSRRSACTATP